MTQHEPFAENWILQNGAIRQICPDKLQLPVYLQALHRPSRAENVDYFDQRVTRLCEHATRLSKREAIRVFSKWSRLFPRSGTHDFEGEVARGAEAVERFRTHDGQEFFALFEYGMKTPITYSCSGLRTEELPYCQDVAIVEREYTWSMLFNHEDGAFADGPYYFHR